jgi:transcriptional regulator with XRE-family HTH domain
MPTTDVGSTVPRRQLGRELRRLREDACVTVEEAAAQLELSRVKMWRIEKGSTAMRSLDVEQMCRLYGAAADITEALMALARETKAKGWWQSYGEVIPPWFELYAGLEAAAARISWYEPELVPGLLQTQDYARALIPSGGPVADQAEVDHRVAARMQRQRVLTRTSPKPLELDVVIGQAVLCRVIGSRAMFAAQLRHLVNVSEKVPTVRIRLVDYAAGPHRGMATGKFEILEFPLSGGRRTEPTTIYSDLGSGALYQEKPRELFYYQSAWQDIDARALSEEATRNRILSAARSVENS